MEKPKTMKFLFHLLGVLLIAIIPLMAVPPPANASAGWTAYNDCAWVSGQLDTNITTYTIPDDGTATGLLKDYATGTDTAVTVTFTASGSPGVQTGTYGGSETDPGTDAYLAFHGIADMPGVIQYGSSGWYVEITFTGLDPDKTYTFATSANRANDYTDRISRFTLLDADTATNTSTIGVTRNNHELHRRYLGIQYR